MARRAETETPATGESAEAPGAIPEGVDADVTVKYRRRVTPSAQPADNGLSDLALEADEDLSPPDPLAAFLEEWSRFSGFNCEVVRLPDPADRRIIINQFARPNFTEFLRLGGMPFDPITFISSLQYINGNSGGVFRVWLTDQTGQMIPGARLERVAISDPAGITPRQRMEDSLRQPQQQAPPPPPQKSEAEIKLDTLKDKLFFDALTRATNPPPPPAPPQGPQMSDEDRLGMMILTKSDLLGNVITKITDAVNAGDKAQSATWKDKAMDFVMQNPAVATQLTSAAERVVIGLTQIAGNFFGGQPTQPVIPQPTQHAPVETPAAKAAASNLPPEAPDDTLDADEDNDMAILDELFALLADTRPIVGTDHVFIQLRTEAPAQFEFYVRMIASATPEQTITFVSNANPLYKSLLESPLTSEHLRKRLDELKALCIAAITPQPAAATPETPEPETGA